MYYPYQVHSNPHITFLPAIAPMHIMSLKSIKLKRTPFDRLVNSSTLTGSLRAAWASSPYLFLKQGPQNWKKEKEKKKSDLMSI